MHIIDRAVEQTPARLWKQRKKVRAVLPRARRFVLTDQASRRLGEIIAKCGPELIANRRFALPPHPVTYVELSIREVNAGIGRGAFQYQDRPTDSRLGFLLYGSTLTISVADDRTGDSMVSALSYVRGGEDQLAQVMEPADWKRCHDWIGAAVRLGSTFHDITSMEDLNALSREWGAHYNYGAVKKRMPMHLVRACFGELRVFLSALLVLNQPQTVRLEHVGARRGDARTRNRPDAAHSVVELTLGEKKEFVKRLIASQRSTPRRHEVRGHFVHHNCTPGCEHEWPLEPTKSQHSDAPCWRCKKCGGTRTWRAAFERGDAGIGFVTKEYAVDYGGPNK